MSNTYNMYTYLILHTKAFSEMYFILNLKYIINTITYIKKIICFRVN